MLEFILYLIVKLSVGHQWFVTVGLLLWEWVNQSFDTAYKMAHLFIYPLSFSYRESVFVFKIKAAVHLAVDGIFSLCFAAGVWRSEWND